MLWKTISTLTLTRHQQVSTPKKMVADAVASLVYNASDNVSTAISLLIQTYKLDNREAEAIQRHLELHKKMLQNDWQMINKTLRGLKAED